MVTEVVRALTSVERGVIARSTLIAAGAVILGLVIPFALNALWSAPVDPVDVIGAALAVGGFGGFLASFVPYVRLGGSRYRSLEGVGPTQRRETIRAVTGRPRRALTSPADGDGNDRARELDFAREFVGTSCLALVLFGCLYLGMIGTQLYGWNEQASPDPLRPGLVLFLAALLILFVGFFVIRVGRAARFLAERE